MVYQKFSQIFLLRTPSFTHVNPKIQMQLGLLGRKSGARENGMGPSWWNLRPAVLRTSLPFLDTVCPGPFRASIAENLQYHFPMKFSAGIGNYMEERVELCQGFLEFHPLERA